MRDPIKRKNSNKKYYDRHKERIIAKEQTRYKLQHKKIRIMRNALYNENKSKFAAQQRKEYAEKRLLVINHYGGKCICCGESEPLFLEIDHINNDGWAHRKKIGTSGKVLVLWIIKNDYPDDFQILCANCNQGKKRNKGICPHKKKSQ